MRCRPGVTLIEVLVAIFIAGIGMLALLALFPLGAVSMAQALRDDRVASAAVIAENIALAFDFRHDPLVVAQFSGTPGAPSNPVYADPWGSSVGSSTVLGWDNTNQISVARIQRTNLSFIVPGGGAAVGGAARWCTLLDDITFSTSPQDGTPDRSLTVPPINSPTPIQRAGWYTWAYMLQRPDAATDAVVNLSVVVYQKRPIGLAPNEYPYYAVSSVATNPNAVTLSWDPTKQPQPPIRRNTWLLDTSITAHGDFYRVVNVTEITGTNSVAIELEQPLKYDTNSMTVMQDVVDVFAKGPAWQP